MIKSNSSGSNGNSIKESFREALKLTKTKKMKKAVTKAATQMKKDIDYKDVLNTKDNTKESTTSGSSSKGGTSNSKSKQHPYLISLDKFADAIAGKDGIQGILKSLYDLIKALSKKKAVLISSLTISLSGQIAKFVSAVYTSWKVLSGQDKNNSSSK